MKLHWKGELSQVMNGGTCHVLGGKGFFQPDVVVQSVGGLACAPLAYVSQMSLTAEEESS